jgi:hypothetical protein
MYKRANLSTTLAAARAVLCEIRIDVQRWLKYLVSNGSVKIARHLPAYVNLVLGTEAIESTKGCKIDAKFDEKTWYISRQQNISKLAHFSVFQYPTSCLNFLATQ